MDCSFLSQEGKVALVTGGSRGIGKSIALAFADAGADLVLASRKLEDLEKVADEIRAMGRKALCVPTHAKKIPDLENLVEKTMAEFGRIATFGRRPGGEPLQFLGELCQHSALIEIAGDGND